MFTPDPTGGQGLAGAVAPPQAPLDPAILGATPVEQDDGSVELHLDDSAALRDPRAAPHDANLAEVLDESTLSRIAQDLMEGIEADVDSNQEYYDTIARGLKLLGLKPGERMEKPFPGASAATHPLLKEAVARFCANAGGELLPADGPARCRIFGDATPDVEQRAQRKALWLNYYLTEQDEEYADDFDQMLLLLGINGSMFRKVWRDPLRGGAATSRHYSPFDIIVSHHATTMHGPYRVTHIEPMPASEVKRLQLRAWFADIELTEPADDRTPAREHVESADWRRPTDRPEDVDHVIWHCHCLLDLEGLEHEGEDGEPTGLALPYIVSIERDSGKVLRIARNWSQSDETFRPREYYCHYRYMPGIGFYGWGLIHLVGADTDTLSVMRRQAINAMTLYSFPGGLKTKSVAGESSDLTVGPGQFKDVETGGQPIQSAVMPMPYRDVSPAYPAILQEVLQGGQRVGSVSDAAVGDTREDALPGTVLALIRQATKVESAVIKRLHRAQRKELRLLADLFGTMDQETYPYAINGQRGVALKGDFADNADVCPVADPNIPTQTERLALAQATITIAGQSNGMMQMRPAIEGFLRVMGKTDGEIAELMPPPNSGQPADPITEFRIALQGGPLVAGPMQDHAAHVQAHMAQLATPGLMGAPPGNALMAHIADHTAHFYAAQFAQLTGMQLPQGPVPPQVENQLAGAAAAASGKLREMMQQLAPQQAGADPNETARLALERDQLAVQREDQARKSEETARQDQIEITRLAETMRDNDAQRRADLVKAELALRTAAIKGHGQVASDAIGHASEVVASHAAVHVAREKTEQARHGARARDAAARTRPPETSP